MEYREKITKFEDTLGRLFKSLNTYLDAAKVAYEAEAAFCEEMRKFYSDPEPVIIGSTGDMVVKLCDIVASETTTMFPLVNLTDRCRLTYS